MILHSGIFAGSSRTGLWPSSWIQVPQQSASCKGEASLFQDTLSRLKDQGGSVPMVATDMNVESMGANQTATIDAELDQVVVGPKGRTTGPTIFTASLSLDANPNDLMLVLPADHQIRGLRL